MSLFNDMCSKIKENNVKKKQYKVLLKEREIHHKEVVKQEKLTRNEDKIAPKDSYISLKKINKIYPNHIQAVFDFNLDIKKHEFIVFVGPSGCGKSTTLRMIAGLENITSGDLFIDGEYVNELEAKDRDISMVFQSYALYPHMTVYDNMAFGLKVNHVKKKEIDERVRKAAEILQISEYLDRKPSALSGGQCQRVALGRAICKDAKVFLMDEPLSNLDAKLRVQMRTEIVKLHYSLKATTIYVTHDQTEAMTMASRIVVMNKGYVQQIGTPSEIYNLPENLFVATFVGSPAMNIFNVVVDSEDVCFGDFKLKLLKKDSSSIINEFYDNQIVIYSKKLEKLKEDYLKREQQKKKYLDLINEINENKLKELFAPYNCDISEIISNINSLDIKSLIDNKLKEVVFNKNYQENIEVKDLCETLAKLIKERKNLKHNLIFGIRPEDIHKTLDSNDNSLKLRVNVAELLGSEYFVHFDFANGDLIAKIDTNEIILKDSIINVSFDKNKIHIFDPITTKRII